MKSIRNMTRLELAGFIASQFYKQNINMVLSGGSCVSIYSKEKYVSMDLDFVNAGFAKRNIIASIMEKIGFKDEKKYFRHPHAKYLIEFPSGPLGVGNEQINKIDEIDTETGILRIISPTDCVKDRLTWFYHDNDSECLRQAILVAQNNRIRIKEVERWSVAEGKGEEFKKIKKQLSA